MSIDKILRDKLIPWSNNAAERIIIARPRMRASMMPDDVQLEKRTLSGKRTIIKKQRTYRNTRCLVASWPHGLNEINILKLACVTSGYVNFQLGRQAVLCGPGHFMFIPPGMPHPDGTHNITDSRKSTFCEVLYFHLFPSAVQCWISRYEPDLDHPRRLENYLLTHEHATKLFQILMEATLSTPAGSMELSEMLLQSFLRVVQREVHAGRCQEIPHGDDKQSQNFHDATDFSEHLHQYIQSHLYDRPTLENTARKMYLSRAQFSRRVRAETGKTFVEILNEHRINTAKELLRDSDWTINSITTFIGYRSTNHFQVLFRKHTGVTPNMFRQQKRKIETIP